MMNSVDSAHYPSSIKLINELNSLKAGRERQSKLKQQQQSILFSLNSKLIFPKRI